MKLRRTGKKKKKRKTPQKNKRKKEKPKKWQNFIFGLDVLNRVTSNLSCLCASFGAWEIAKCKQLPVSVGKSNKRPMRKITERVQIGI